MAIQKIGIVASLQKRGFSVKNVRELNKILREMGFLNNYANGWETTKKGLEYSIYRSQGLNDNLWYEKIVDVIAEYLKKK